MLCLGIHDRQRRTLTNAGEDTLVSCFESRHRITMCPASHIQQSRYISHLRSRNRGAETLLQHARVMNQVEMPASIFGKYRNNRADFLTDMLSKRSHLRSRAGKPGYSLSVVDRCEEENGL